MKAERKHELEKNELDSFLHQAGDWLRDNWAVLGIGAAVVVLAVFTYNLITHQRPMSAPAGDKWREFLYAMSDKDVENELDKFIDENQKSKDAPVVWARLLLAERKLADGAKQLFEDRQLAEENISEAEKLFLSVEKEATGQQELLDRARIGLAKVYESQNKPDEAVKQYDQVLSSSRETPLGKVAQRGKERLSSESNREFLAWFAEQKPLKRPPAGKSPSTPLPEGPDFSIPSLENSKGKSDPSGLTFPGSRTPPPDPVPPTDDSPEPRGKPSDDTPPEDSEGSKADPIDTPPE